MAMFTSVLKPGAEAKEAPARSTSLPVAGPIASKVAVVPETAIDAASDRRGAPVARLHLGDEPLPFESLGLDVLTRQPSDYVNAAPGEDEGTSRMERPIGWASDLRARGYPADAEGRWIAVLWRDLACAIDGGAVERLQSAQPTATYTHDESPWLRTIRPNPSGRPGLVRLPGDRGGLIEYVTPGEWAMIEEHQDGVAWVDDVIDPLNCWIDTVDGFAVDGEGRLRWVTHEMWHDAYGRAYPHAISLNRVGPIGDTPEDLTEVVVDLWLGWTASHLPLSDRMDLALRSEVLEPFAD